MKPKAVIPMVLTLTLFLLTACGDSNGEGENEVEGQEVYQIQLAHSSPASNDRLEESLQVFKDNVEERSNGLVEVTTYPASQLGSERAQLENVQLGSVEMAALSSGPFPGFFKEMMIFDLPFIFENEEIAYEVLDSDYGDQILDLLLEETGVRGLAWGENGVRHFTNSQRPIEEPDDLTGLTIRTQENPAHMATVEALGAIPNPMAFSEVYSALQQGVIDGQENPISLIESMRFYEVNQYLTLDGHFYNTFTLIINNDYYESMPEDIQTIVQEEADTWSDDQRSRNRTQVEEGLEVIEEAGVEIIELTDEEKEEFQEKTQPVIEEYRSILGDELVDELFEAIEAAEKEVSEKE
ncbi:DctP family TRAP transporter solute-binding subunit [Sinobaca sp. H24]|uniref:TRAP transporter substrate-binding protein n=1 Tax=Sinobaca sp. H24 TaxID=2923376 RepID=UPI00207A2653|nr:DctP family TRAP transporter solute-binding subunit [Sinobaca sp. H24]